MGLRFSSFKDLANTKVGRKNLIRESTNSPEKKKHSNARRVKVDGISFDSQLEADYYGHLKILQRAGEVLRFHRQVIFDLNGVAAKIDFMVIFADGRIEYHDPKGRVMPSWVRNKKQIESIYGVVVKEIFKGDF